MSVRIFPVPEHPVPGFEVDAASGRALARVIDAHPALAPLLDFVSVDPVEIALAVGMVSPLEEDGAADLEELDLGAEEWFEPSAGLMAVQRAGNAIRKNPESIARAIYDPELRPGDVLADLEAMEAALQWAQQHETRFHLAVR